MVSLIILIGCQNPCPGWILIEPVFFLLTSRLMGDNLFAFMTGQLSAKMLKTVAICDGNGKIRC